MQRSTTLNRVPRWAAAVAVAAVAGFGFAARHNVEANDFLQAPSTPQKEAAMTHHARGPFDVKLSPQEPSGQAAAAGIGRMAIDKQFHGDLEATSQGEMVAFMTSIKTSAGYVAIEKVTGTLQGRSGSFVLQHSGIATAAAQDLTITVVPDSGSGDLTGLSGRMTITIAEGGKHSYDFEYSLPKTP